MFSLTVAIVATAMTDFLSAEDDISKMDNTPTTDRLGQNNNPSQA